MDESVQALYTALPLTRAEDIRVLDLAPAPDPNDPLHGRLRVTPRHWSKVKYEALSYTWGPPFESQTLEDGSISVESHTPKLGLFNSALTRNVTKCVARGVLKITGNLDHALRRLRLRSAIRCLWIDAICICQYDEAEKGRQVGRMHAIYSQADRVLVWLGEDDDGDGRFVFGLKNLKPSRKDQAAWTECIATFQNPSWLIETFLSRRYFSRRWVVQELMAHINNTEDHIRVLCGPAVTSWNSLQNALAVILQFAGLQTERLMQVIESASYFHLTHPHSPRYHSAKVSKPLGDPATFGLTFLELLCGFAHTECVDDRDRVYALASLWPQSRYKVNYSLSCTEIYIALSMAVLQATDHLTFGLAAVRMATVAAYQHASPRADDRLTMLASWMPDWRLPVPVDLRVFGEFRDYFKGGCLARVGDRQALVVGMPIDGVVTRMSSNEVEITNQSQQTFTINTGGRAYQVGDLVTAVVADRRDDQTHAVADSIQGERALLEVSLVLRPFAAVEHTSTFQIVGCCNRMHVTEIHEARNDARVQHITIV